ncbi:MAG: TonB-dependent receptor [Bacteroidetes bacterium]|nr:TonB-dependent receptor [Bacteroidota bacterium]
MSIQRSGGEANKVVLRGLSDKYTTVTLDGIRIPPTDADSRGVDLSTIAQGSLAGVELYKALTPDKDADALGGSINLVTRRAPTERLLWLDARGIYNHLMASYDQYDVVARYGERFFDDVLGVQVGGNVERRNRSSERVDLDYNQTLAQGNDYEINEATLQFSDEIRNRYGANLLLDVNTPDEGSIRFNTNFSRTDRSYLLSTRNYPYASGLRVTYSARDREQEIKTFTSALQGDNNLLGLKARWGLSFAESDAEFPYDFAIDFIEPSIIEDSVVVSGMSPGVPSIKSNPEQLIPYALNNYQAAYLNEAYYRYERNIDREKTAFLDLSRAYTLSDILSGELRGGGKYKHKDREKVSTQRYSPYYLGYWREFTGEQGEAAWRKDFTGTWFESFYQRYLLDRSARNPFALDFLDAPPASRQLYDLYDLNPIVNRDALRLWYTLNQAGRDSLGRSLEFYNDPSVEADYYDVIERVSSAFLMNTFQWGPLVTFIAGVRVEREDNDYGSKFSPSGLGGFPIPSGGISDTTASHSETNWMPNFHLAITPTEYMKVRVAAYRALSRPYYNLRLDIFVSQGGGWSVSLLLGNSQLKKATAWNYELQTSFFGNTFGLISASVFYKEIEDVAHVLRNASTIGNSVIDMLGIAWRTPHSGSYALTVPYNSPRTTKVWGLEFEHQLSLNFLPGFLENFILSYNASFVGSETYILATDTFTVYVRQPTGFPPPFDSINVPITNNKIVERKQNLEGQPKVFANVMLGYDLGDLSARLSVFYQGEYNQSFSASGLSDQIINSFTRLDLALKYQITRNIAVMVNLSNLTNIDDRNSIYNRSTGWKLLNTSEQYGFTADLGVRLNL